MTPYNFKKIVSFVSFAEKLKSEQRSSRLSNGKNENVASHSWRVCLLIMLLTPFFEDNFDFTKAIKMAIVHDLPEVVIGDVSYEEYEKSEEAMLSRSKQEADAMVTLKKMLPNSLGEELFDLWFEFETSQSIEAKVVQAVDKLEAQIQDNQTDLKYWTAYEYKSAQTRLNKYCEFNEVLNEVMKIIQKDSEVKAKLDREIKI